MDQSDEEHEVAMCSECGADIDGQSDPVYTYGSSDILCYECASRRGGCYDQFDHRWIQLPDLTGLPGQPAQM